MAPLKRLHLLLGLAAAFVLMAHHPEAPVDPGEPAKAWVQVAQLVIAVGLSLLAGYLLQDANKATLRDDKPTTLTTRGSYLNWFLGVRRVGPVFAWAGERGNTEESGGKKGGSGPKVKIWNEWGWHLVGVGPADCMYRILQNGKQIFSGPITRIGTPSGSFIDLGSEGGFWIYWGEPTQPVNNELGNSNRVGISSRWPYHCYILWKKKRLGQAPNWPLLDYEMERFPSASLSIVTSEPALISDPPVLDGATHTITAINTGVDDWIEVDGAVASLTGKDLLRLSGNALPDQDLTVLEVEQIVTGGPFIFVTSTRVHVAEDLTGADVSGTIQEYTLDARAGVNGAHGFAELLFAPWPLGFGEDPNPVTGRFDIQSLNDLATLLAAEDLRTSWLAKEGARFNEILGAALQDMGVMLPIDTATGKLKFQPLRDPTGTILPRVREQLLAESLPEIETTHGPRPVDKLVFSFPDRNISDREATIAVMDDGQVSYHENQRARTVQITVTTDFATASIIAQRRSQEELAHNAVMRIATKRATRALIPGQAVVFDNIPQVMRVTDVKVDTEAPVVTIQAIVDNYGVKKTEFIDNPGGSDSGILPPEPDLAKAIIEIPERLLGAEEQTIIVPRIRAHAQVSEAQVHISGDNITYVPQGPELDLQTGGTLTAEFNADEDFFLANGPEITSLGPDIGIVEDLTSDLLNWNLGRQIAVIVSSAGCEICFVRSITSTGGDNFRLDGLYRARYDTQRYTHPAGSAVFIFIQDNVLAIQDLLVQPDQDLYAKTQPQAGGILPLSADAPTFRHLYGKGPRPIPVSGLSVRAPFLSNAWRAGDDTEIVWTYPTPQTPAAGYGSQALGQASVPPSPDGSFRLEILTGATLRRTETVTSPTYTYTDADRIADGVTVDFTVRITNLRGGLESTPVTIDVEEIL